MTHAKVYSAYQARSIQRIDFLTTFTDASPDGPPGDYTVTYRCQYSYNGLNTNPPRQPCPGPGASPCAP